MNGTSRMLKEAVEGALRREGARLPSKDEDVTMPERHLGLMMPSQSSGEAPGVERLADLAEKIPRYQGILEMSRVKATGILSRRDSVSFAAVIGKPHMVRMAVARRRLLLLLQGKPRHPRGAGC